MTVARDLRSYRTPAVVANEVCMLRSTTGAVWLVQTDDASKFFRSIISPEARLTVSGPAAIAEVLDIVRGRGCCGVIAIVDVPPGQGPPAPPCFAPDEGDLDCMLLASKALEKVLSQNDDCQNPEMEARALRIYLARRQTANGGASNTEVTTATWRLLSGEKAVSALEFSLGSTIRRDLILAYPVSDFIQTRLFLQIALWELRTQIRTMRELRDRDPLGAVSDQRYWERELAYFIDTCSASTPIAAIKLDLDHFKEVNEELGHSVGDYTIRRYCEIIRDEIGLRGQVYRRGGDEVLVIMPSVSVDESGSIAEKLRSAIENGLRSTHVQHPPTASIGVLHLTEPCTCSAATASLDRAQKEAKRKGKNRVEMADGPDIQAGSELAAHSQLG